MCSEMARATKEKEKNIAIAEELTRVKELADAQIKVDKEDDEFKSAAEDRIIISTILREQEETDMIAVACEPNDPKPETEDPANELLLLKVLIDLEKAEKLLSSAILGTVLINIVTFVPIELNK
jgi:hypothetical protein